jgi:hypothetical protein
MMVLKRKKRLKKKGQERGMGYKVQKETTIDQAF